MVLIVFRITLAFWGAMVFTLINPVTSLHADEANAEILKSLESDWDTWLSDVTINAKYVYSDAVVESVDDEIGKGQVLIKAHGRMIKDNDNALYSCIVDQDKSSPRQVHDFVVVSSRELEARYLPSASRGSASGSPIELYVMQHESGMEQLPYPWLAMSPPIDLFTYGGGKQTPNPITALMSLKEIDPRRRDVISDRVKKRWVGIGNVHVRKSIRNYHDL